jgi:hypothetical protein
MACHEKRREAPRVAIKYRGNKLRLSTSSSTAGAPCKYVESSLIDVNAGVHRSRKRFFAYLYTGVRRFSVGTYDTQEEAARAYDKYVRTGFTLDGLSYSYLGLNTLTLRCVCDGPCCSTQGG